LDRRRAQREDERRWHAERRQTYAAFLAAGRALYEELWDQWQSGLARQTRIALVRDVASRRYEVSLIASRNVFEAADEVYEALSDMADRIQETDRNLHTRQASAAIYHEKLISFIAAVRRELGANRDGERIGSRS
jgi:hypothetical protein